MPRLKKTQVNQGENWDGETSPVSEIEGVEEHMESEFQEEPAAATTAGGPMSERQLRRLDELS